MAESKYDFLWMKGVPFQLKWKVGNELEPRESVWLRFNDSEGNALMDN